MIRIDVAVDLDNMFWCQGGKAGSFWDNSSEQLMTNFNAAFFPWGIWITEKHSTTTDALAGVLDAFRICKLLAVIC